VNAIVLLVLTILVTNPEGSRVDPRLGALNDFSFDDHRPSGGGRSAQNETTRVTRYRTTEYEELYFFVVPSLPYPVSSVISNTSRSQTCSGVIGENKRYNPDLWYENGVKKSSSSRSGQRAV